MTNTVVKDDEVAVDVEQLPRAKQDIRKLRLQKLPCSASRPMKQEYCIRNSSIRIANRLAER